MSDLNDQRQSSRQDSKIPASARVNSRLKALNNSAKNLRQATTDFAGVDMKDDDVVWFIHRHQIEGSNPDHISDRLHKAFAEFC